MSASKSLIIFISALVACAFSFNLNQGSITVAATKQLATTASLPEELLTTKHGSDKKSVNVGAVIESILLSVMHEEDTTILNDLDSLRDIFIAKVKPIQDLFHYEDLGREIIGEADIFSKPVVAVIGQSALSRATVLSRLTNQKDSIFTKGSSPAISIYCASDDNSTSKSAHNFANACGTYFTMADIVKNATPEQINVVSEISCPALNHFTFVDISSSAMVMNTNNDSGNEEQDTVEIIERVLTKSDLVVLVIDAAHLSTDEKGTKLETFLKSYLLEDIKRLMVVVLDEGAESNDHVQESDYVKMSSRLLWMLEPCLTNLPTPPPIFVLDSGKEINFVDDEDFRVKQLINLAKELASTNAPAKFVSDKIGKVYAQARLLKAHIAFLAGYCEAYQEAAQDAVPRRRSRLAAKLIGHPEKFNVFERALEHAGSKQFKTLVLELADSDELPIADDYETFFSLHRIDDVNAMLMLCDDDDNSDDVGNQKPTCSIDGLNELLSPDHALFASTRHDTTASDEWSKAQHQEKKRNKSVEVDLTEDSDEDDDNDHSTDNEDDDDDNDDDVDDDDANDHDEEEDDDDDDDDDNDADESDNHSNADEQDDDDDDRDDDDDEDHPVKNDDDDDIDDVNMTPEFSPKFSTRKRKHVEESVTKGNSMFVESKEYQRRNYRKNIPRGMRYRKAPVGKLPPVQVKSSKGKKFDKKSGEKGGSKYKKQSNERNYRKAPPKSHSKEKSTEHKKTAPSPVSANKYKKGESSSQSTSNKYKEEAGKPAAAVSKQLPTASEPKKPDVAAASKYRKDAGKTAVKPIKAAAKPAHASGGLFDSILALISGNADESPKPSGSKYKKSDNISKKPPVPKSTPAPVAAKHEPIKSFKKPEKIPTATKSILKQTPKDSSGLDASTIFTCIWDCLFGSSSSTKQPTENKYKKSKSEGAVNAPVKKVVKPAEKSSSTGGLEEMFASVLSIISPSPSKTEPDGSKYRKPASTPTKKSTPAKKIPPKTATEKSTSSEASLGDSIMSAFNNLVDEGPQALLSLLPSSSDTAEKPNKYKKPGNAKAPVKKPPPPPSPKVVKKEASKPAAEKFKKLSKPKKDDSDAVDFFEDLIDNVKNMFDSIFQASASGSAKESVGSKYRKQPGSTKSAAKKPVPSPVKQLASKQPAPKKSFKKFDKKGKADNSGSIFGDLLSYVEDQIGTDIPDSTDELANEFWDMVESVTGQGDSKSKSKKGESGDIMDTITSFLPDEQAGWLKGIINGDSQAGSKCKPFQKHCSSGSPKKATPAKPTAVKDNKIQKPAAAKVPNKSKNTKTSTKDSDFDPFEMIKNILSHAFGSLSGSETSKVGCSKYRKDCGSGAKTKPKPVAKQVPPKKATPPAAPAKENKWAKKGSKMVASAAPVVSVNLDSTISDQKQLPPPAFDRLEVQLKPAGVNVEEPPPTISILSYIMNKLYPTAKPACTTNRFTDHDSNQAPTPQTHISPKHAVRRNVRDI